MIRRQEPSRPIWKDCPWADDKAANPSHVNSARKLTSSIAQRRIRLTEIVVFTIARRPHHRMVGPFLKPFYKATQHNDPIAAVRVPVSIDDDKLLGANRRIASGC